MSFDTDVTQKLKDQIAELKGRSEKTVLGFRLNDFSEYRFSAGYCLALDNVSAILDDITAELQQK
jgi:hypothetical protein